MKRGLEEAGFSIGFSLYFIPLLLCFLFLPLFPAFEAYAGEKNRERADSFYRKAGELFDSGDVGNAVEAIKKALKADPEYPEAYDMLGHMLIKKGEFDDAIASFNSALKINPRLRTSKTGIGFALLGKGDLKEAESAFMAALKLNPYPSTAHYGLGLVHEKLKDYEEAIHHFKEGIQKYRSGKR
jgi:tetratricopeptide (TPR) repeat protein